MDIGNEVGGSKLIEDIENRTDGYQDVRLPPSRVLISILARIYLSTIADNLTIG